MADSGLLVKALDEAFWELGEAFKGLPDADVWRRADPRLLSVGELATHVAYWEATSFFGDARVESPLMVAARYYTANSTELFELQMNAEEVYEEVKRIHGFVQGFFRGQSSRLRGAKPEPRGFDLGADA